METAEGTIAVIGAGSTGASTAYHLAKAGAKVALIDAGQPAFGTTSRSTAIVRTHYSNEIVARMALYSLNVLRNFGEIGNSGFVPNGILMLASNNEKPGMLSNLEMLKNIGVVTEELDPEEARKQFPCINFEKIDCIVYEPESGYADPVATANSYASKSRELGAILLLEHHVKSLETNEGKLVGIRFDDGSRVACSKAILCTNVWTNKLLSASGVSDEKLLPIWAAPHPVVVMKRAESYQGDQVTVADILNKIYFKPEGKSLLFMGSLDSELDRQFTDPDNPLSEVPFEFMTSCSEYIVERVPAMREGILHSAYIGMYDVSPDQHPIIDELSDIGLSGVYSCVGLSGHGFKLCPSLGLMNSEMLLDRQGQFDRQHFTLQRFKEGKLFTSKYSVGTIA